MEEWQGWPLRSRGWPRWWSGGKWGSILRHCIHAAVTDFVWLRRMKLVLDDAKKEGQGACPCHQV